MSYKKYIRPETSGEFELDLAPLLAVVVKLVPVLLVSSAFMQLMIIETELPQAVREAIAQNNTQPEAEISLLMDPKIGFQIQVENQGKVQTTEVALKDGGYDYPALHEALIGVKKTYPKVFKLSLAPSGSVENGEIVRAMDEARRARDAQVTFPMFDTQQQKDVQTPYMFPEVVFANALEAS